MATALVEPETRCETLADLLERLGDIPPDRVLLLTRGLERRRKQICYGCRMTFSGGVNSLTEHWW